MKGPRLNTATSVAAPVVALLALAKVHQTDDPSRVI